MKQDLTVIEAKRVGIIKLDQTSSLFDFAKIMVDQDVSAVVVVDSKAYLAGIITRTDLLRALVSSNEWETLPVERFMNKDVITVPEHTTLYQVADLLLEKQIHRVIVIREENNKKKPISIVSAADIVYHMTKEI